jgi:hypothetical protein
LREEHNSELLTQSHDFAASIISARASKRAKTSEGTSSFSTKDKSNDSGDMSTLSSYVVSLGSTSSSRKAPPVISANVSNLSKKSSSGGFSIQTKLTGVNQEARTMCTAAIASFVQGLGLPWSLVDEPKFRHMLKMARLVDKNYTPPSRKEVAGPLLDINYDNHMQKQKALLLSEADMYGLVIYGDGATVRRLALFNILAAGIHIPNAVLEIVDTYEHTMRGGIKSAEYIADIVKSHMQVLDPGKTLFDIVYFDGASNVQKAGHILEQYYPRLTCLHAVEHLVSLFLQILQKYQPLILS